MGKTNLDLGVLKATEETVRKPDPENYIFACHLIWFHLPSPISLHT
jgi:hypothetical protein